ncbi:hypothetical protein D3C80_1508540 [compost metagenome]
MFKCLVVMPLGPVGHPFIGMGTNLAQQVGQQCCPHQRNEESGEVGQVPTGRTPGRQALLTGLGVGISGGHQKQPRIIFGPIDQRRYPTLANGAMPRLAFHFKIGFSICQAQSQLIKKRLSLAQGYALAECCQGLRRR